MTGISMAAVTIELTSNSKMSIPHYSESYEIIEMEPLKKSLNENFSLENVALVVTIISGTILGVKNLADLFNGLEKNNVESVFSIKIVCGEESIVLNSIPDEKQLKVACEKINVEIE
jgi:hypothetical protein